MKKELNLITRQFPYGNSENFLESEIIILSNFFDNIIIYPCTKNNSIRTLPHNVIVKNDICDKYKSKVFWIGKTIVSVFFYRSIILYLNRLNSIKILFGLFKYSTSYLIYDDFCKNFFSNKSNTLVYSYWYTSIVDTMLLHRDAHTKIVCRVHRGDLYEEFNPMSFFPYRQKYINSIDKIYSISNHGLNYLVGKYFVNNIEVSRLGVFDKFHLNQGSTSAFSITSVSNIIKIKRVDLIAESILLLAKLHPSINIIWNHFGDGSEFTNVINILNSQSFPNLIYKFNGRVANDDIYEYYINNSVDVFVNLSASEGIPVSIMEALSFGIPVIATNVGGVSEIVCDLNGRLLPANPLIEEIVEAFYFLKKYPKDRSIIKKNWSENYSAQVNYSKFSLDLISLKQGL